MFSMKKEEPQFFNKNCAVYYQGLSYAFELLTFFMLIYLQTSVFNITMNDNNSTDLGLAYLHARIQNIGLGFLINTSPDPLKNHKATKPASMLGQHRHASETPKWCFAGGPMMARLYWYLDPSSPYQLNITKTQHQSWIPSGKTFWIRA